MRHNRFTSSALSNLPAHALALACALLVSPAFAAEPRVVSGQIKEKEDIATRIQESVEKSNQSGKPQPPLQIKVPATAGAEPPAKAESAPRPAAPSTAASTTPSTAAPVTTPTAAPVATRVAAPKPVVKPAPKVAAKTKTAPASARAATPVEQAPAFNAASAEDSREYIRAKAQVLAQKGIPPAADDHHGHGHGAAWSYEGATGPQAWGNITPQYSTCDRGRRQSPIHITDADSLPGPAEPLQLNYQPSGGSIVNNGHTIQVDLDNAANTLTVRGSTYRLVQFHFHHPAEERINFKSFAMVAHLVYRNEDNQLAVLAVLMDPGAPSPLLHKLWTHMPLDAKDRVKLPAGLVDLNELLPQDLRYYQFMGSLTTPPCSEGVLWLVLKAPVTVGADQLQLFAKLFPNNARPTQPLNGRVVREAR